MFRSINLEQIMLSETIKLMTTGNQGILAADESVPTITKRFEANGIPATAEARFEYRKMLFSTENLSQHIAAIILHEETLTQMGQYCASLNMVPGIKVDQGLMDYAGHKITRGLDTLEARLPTYKTEGARFCKWRAVYSVVDNPPLAWAINALHLAMYAKICQNHDLVPIVEPEILLSGDYSLEQAIVAHKHILAETFAQLAAHNVDLKHMILKPSMVLAGADHAQQPTTSEIAEATVATFMQVLPAELAGINFLSGGQTPAQAAERLQAIRALSQKHASPFRFSFSYARALQEPAMKLFAESNIADAQSALLERAEANTAS